MTTSEQQARQERFDKGMKVFSAVDGHGGQAVVDSLQDIAPELGYQIVAWGFGEMYAREQLAPRDRQLVTLGMLTALGGCEPQLEVHIGTSLNVGLTPTEIIEAFTHAVGYCGFPKALNAIAMARKVFTERGLMPLVSAPH